MSSLGQWLGRWAGAWFGAAGETDPNAAAAAAVITVSGTGTLGAIGWISASATVSLGGVGALTDGEAVQPPVVVGGGRWYYPHIAVPYDYLRERRRKRDEDVIAAMVSH
jgi:hypothetical protein